MHPKISVIIPVYNVEKYLERCLESVLRQDLDAFEVICVDDGSTDSTPEILARCAAQYENLRVVRRENGGPSAARNAGLDVARGIYVQFVDSDDRLLSADALSRVFRRAEEADADVLIFGCEPEFTEEEYARTQAGLREYLHRADAYPDGLSGMDLFVRLWGRDDYVVGVWSHLFRREFIESNGLRFANGLLFEDQLFTLQCLSLARRTAQLVDHIYCYCVRKGSIMTSLKAEQAVYSYFMIASAMRDFYRERLADAPEEFQKCYFHRVQMLIGLGTDSLRSLPRARRRALLRRLTPPARKLARADGMRDLLRRARRFCKKLFRKPK